VVQHAAPSAFVHLSAKTNESIYAALRGTRNGNADAMNEVQEEFERQRGAKLTKGLL